jgi:hypothetical protein
MTLFKRWLIFLSMILPVVGFAQTPIIFSSSIQQNTLLELYTSEGCSSCPPADRWLSTLKTDARLWKEIIPVAFHVDYWDYLGWKDEFSKAEYTQRQQNYARWNNLRTIYTPGFMQNGKEWRGWSRGRNPKGSGSEKVGKLTVTLLDNSVTASFRPEKETTGTVMLNVAWLGFDLETAILAGENEGKKLTHDFVSMSTDVIQGVLDNNIDTWKFAANIKGLTTIRGAAFWITNGENPTPVQATGGWLNKGGNE